MNRFHIFDPSAPTTPLASAESFPAATLAMRTLARDAFGVDPNLMTIDYALVILDVLAERGDVDVYRVRRENVGEARLIGYPTGSLAPILVNAARVCATDTMHDPTIYPEAECVTLGASDDARARMSAHRTSPRERGDEGGHDDTSALPDGEGNALRFVYVIDASTRIPAMVVILHRARSAGRRVAWRAGYTPDSPYALVTDLTTLETQHDPCMWRNTTMRAFHRLILEGASTRNFCTLNALAVLPDGQEVNVELYREAMVQRDA